MVTKPVTPKKTAPLIRAMEQNLQSFLRSTKLLSNQKKPQNKLTKVEKKKRKKKVENKTKQKESGSVKLGYESDGLRTATLISSNYLMVRDLQSKKFRR